MREIAAAKGAKPGQIALAWLLHKGDDIAPIPGTKRRTYLEENVAAEAIGLDPAEMQALDDALGAGQDRRAALPRLDHGDDRPLTGRRNSFPGFLLGKVAEGRMGCGPPQ